jgi:hypothetical protein
MRADAVGATAFIADDDGTILEPVCRASRQRRLAPRPAEDQIGQSFRVDARVDLRGESASASAHTTISVLCGPGTLMHELSII